MREQYDLYQQYLGPIPEFMNKYLKLDILLRLKDISLLCGMDYASKYAYDFSFFISRYDHSLNVALITWKLTHDKSATLAALFHDVASPVFSHVIDYMNGDYINQESTEEKTEEILRNSKELKLMLELDGVAIDDILDFKIYPIVDSKRPKLCADRLDNILAVGMTWVKSIDYDIAKSTIDKISVVINEDGDEEIALNDINLANILTKTNDEIDKLTHTNTDTYMMMLVANMVKRCIDIGIVSYDELFTIGEHDIISLIETSIINDERLKELWKEYKTIESFPLIEQPEIKRRNVDPIVIYKRLSQCK